MQRRLSSSSPHYVKRESDVDIVSVPFETVVDSNFVAVFDLGILLNINALVSKNESMFDPRTAAKVLFVHPRTTAMIFCTGKVLVVGARTEEHALLTSWLLVREMRRVGYVRATVNDFHVCNITSTYKLRGAFDALKYAEDFPFTSVIWGDVFPGIKITFPNLKIVLMAFNSGSVNVTGCVHPDETLAVLDAKLPVLRKYLVQDPAGVRSVFARAEADRRRARTEANDDAAGGSRTKRLRGRAKTRHKNTETRAHRHTGNSPNEDGANAAHARLG